MRMMSNRTERKIPALWKRAGRLAAAALIALGAGVGAAHAQPDLAAIEPRIVIVRAFDRVEMALGDISGLAADGGLVVTNAHMLRGAETVVVVLPGDEQEFPAEIRSLDERSGVAILEAVGLEPGGEAAVLNHPDAAPEVDDTIHVPRFAADGALDSELSLGQVSELRQLEPALAGDRAVLLYRHNAELQFSSYGLPMLNHCGEVVGLIRPDPDMSLRQRNERSDPEGAVFGTEGDEIRRALVEAGGGMEAAAEPCVQPDSETAIEAAQAEAEELENQLEQERQEAEDARAEAEAAQQKVDELEDDVEATAEDLEEARAEAEKLQVAAEEKEAELDDLEQRADDANARVEELEQQLAQERQEREAEQSRFTTAIVVLVGAVLAVVVAAWLLLARRRRAQQKAEEGRREAEAARSKAEAERREAAEKLEGAVTPAGFSCLLEGADQDGRPVVVKITAEELGSSGGVVVGRNPAQAGVVLNHEEASREHFRLTARGGELSIEDLRSTNGTFVNGVELRPGQTLALSSGDEIGVGAAIRVTLTINRAAK